MKKTTAKMVSLAQCNLCMKNTLKHMKNPYNDGNVSSLRLDQRATLRTWTPCLENSPVSKCLATETHQYTKANLVWAFQKDEESKTKKSFFLQQIKCPCRVSCNKNSRPVILYKLGFFWKSLIQFIISSWIHAVGRYSIAQ